MGTTSPTRIDDELYASAKVVGSLMSRSAAQQIGHWARIGRRARSRRERLAPGHRSCARRWPRLRPAECARTGCSPHRSGLSGWTSDAITSISRRSSLTKVVPTSSWMRTAMSCGAEQAVEERSSAD